MQRDEQGRWRAAVQQAWAGQLYKFRLLGPDGSVDYRADAYAVAAEDGGGQASRLYRSTHDWQDGGWLSYRRAATAPLNACRLFDELPSDLPARVEDAAPLIKQMGYTHLLLPPVLRDASEGALLLHRRIGEPDALATAVDTLHRAGIGVLTEWRSPDGTTPERPSAALCARHLIERFHIDGLILAQPDAPLAALVRRLYPDVRLLGDAAPVRVFDPAPLGDDELSERYEAHVRAPEDKLTLLESRLICRRVADLNHALLTSH